MYSEVHAQIWIDSPISTYSWQNVCLGKKKYKGGKSMYLVAKRE